MGERVEGRGIEELRVRVRVIVRVMVRVRVRVGVRVGVRVILVLFSDTSIRY